MKILTEEKSLELAEMLLRNDKDIKEKLEKKINSIKISGEEYDDTELIAKIKEIENEMNGKANKTEIPNVDNFLSEIPSEYVTESELKIAIANAQLGGDDSEIDLSGYVTTTALNNSLANKSDVGHTHDEYLTEHQSLEDYALKTDIPSTDGLATEEYVITAIANVQLGGSDIDLSNYYTKAEVDDLIDLSNSEGSSNNTSSSAIIETTIYENEYERSIWYYNPTSSESENVACESINFMMNTITFNNIGDSEVLEASLNPSNTTDILSWTSSNNNVATVTSISGTTNATVTAIAKGTTTITATCGNVSSTCLVTINIVDEPDIDDGEGDNNTNNDNGVTTEDTWYQITTNIIPDILGYTPAVDYTLFASNYTNSDYWENTTPYTSTNTNYRQAIIMRSDEFYNTTNLKPLTTNNMFTDTYICGRSSASISDAWVCNELNKQTITFKNHAELYNYQTGTYEDITSLCSAYVIDNPTI